MPCPKHNPKAEKYTDDNALLLAMCSQLAYKSKKTIKNRVENIWKMKCAFFEGKETQAFLAGNKECIFLAFRGTEPKKFRDIIYDLKASLILAPMGKVHKGFLEALTPVWYDIEEKIGEYRNHNQSLWVTGHSLGAALATLAVAQLLSNKIHVNGLYTFGQPRTGDGKFSAKFNSLFQNKTYRFQNDKDVVTRIPLEKMKYKHVGKLLYFDQKGKLHRKPSGAIKNLVQSYVHDEATIWQRLIVGAGICKSEGVADHSMNEYFMLLRNNIAK